MSKLLHLTNEEIDYFKKTEKDFFRAYNLIDKLPLYRRIAVSLHSLAVEMLSCDKQKSIDHHLKACRLYPSIAKDYPIFRKEAGLVS